MDPQKRAVIDKELGPLLRNLFKLAAALCVMAFFWGGQNTRDTMLAFFGGMVSGLTSSQTQGVEQVGQGVQGGRDTQISSTASVPPLKLLGHGCRREYDYQICEGEVRNETDQRLEHVMAEVTFTDKNGTFIKSDSGMLTYQPLMPGQTSPFTVMTINNPQIAHFTMRFKHMFGGELKASR